MKAIVNGKIILKDEIIEGYALLLSDVIEAVIPQDKLPENVARIKKYLEVNGAKA